ncbi:hypothetical protein PINS_up007275 [Pythium insidiosum]|nr:hypothetical protein PINS_up007275 [Pythium insidiosum]
MMYSTPMIATGAERSVAELRLIFERASSRVDMHMRVPIETMQVQAPVVAAEPASEPEPEQEQKQEHAQEPENEQEPARELKKENENNNKENENNENENETETENASAGAAAAAEAEAEPACNPESECEDATAVLSHERETASSVDDDAADKRCSKMEVPLEPTSETGSDSSSGSDVAVAPMPRQACSSSKTRSLLRPPQVTRSAPRPRGVASAPLQVNAVLASPRNAAPEVREAAPTAPTMRRAKSNDQELARARQWRENKKALDSRVAAARPRYMEYTTSSRYIAHREASVAQRQQSTRTNGTTTRVTPTRRPSA